MGNQGHPKAAVQREAVMDVTSRLWISELGNISTTAYPGTQQIGQSSSLNLPDSPHDGCVDFASVPPLRWPA